MGETGIRFVGNTGIVISRKSLFGKTGVAANEPFCINSVSIALASGQENTRTGVFILGGGQGWRGWHGGSWIKRMIMGGGCRRRSFLFMCTFGSWW